MCKNHTITYLKNLFPLFIFVFPQSHRPFRLFFLFILHNFSHLTDFILSLFFYFVRHFSIKFLNFNSVLYSCTHIMLFCYLKNSVCAMHCNHFSLYFCFFCLFFCLFFVLFAFAMISVKANSQTET